MTTGRLLQGAGILAVGVLSIWLYKHSPRKIEFLGSYEKIGAHRVNTLEKLAKSLPHFEIIELDLVYHPEVNVLEVNHPPAPATGLTFTTYMAALESHIPFLWLDIKNLDPSTTTSILSKLNSIITPLGFPKEKILIETRYPEKLGLFTAEGYKTSFYLPQNLNKLKEKEFVLAIDAIKNTLKSQPELAISSEHFDYQIMSTYFPSRTKYIWSLRHAKIGDFKLVRKMLKDTTVAVVLSRYNPL